LIWPAGIASNDQGEIFVTDEWLNRVSVFDKDDNLVRSFNTVQPGEEEPNGAAGIAIATAIASLLSDRPVRTDIAMTGELTLSGLVLPVGGIREKILAAHRSGIRHVILPKENESELEKLPEAIRSEMQLSLVETLADVMKLAIPEL
jgi:predicted ATP-dependent serine protease